MASIDMPLEELRSYVPEPSEAADFDEFWARTLSEARKTPLDVELSPAEPPLAGVQSYALRFGGLGGARIAGWYMRPDGDGPHPGVVYYHGYSGRGARPLELYTLAAQGVAVLSMDCRGQEGDSPDIPAPGSGHHTGWLTQGLDDPEHHYYRYVYSDAVRAVDALCSFAEVDRSRIAVIGASQGGGLTLAAAALSGAASFAWSDIPFLCDFKRAVEIAPEGPYTEISGFLRRRPELEETAFHTLSYFDGANLASRVTCPVGMTVTLWDLICPPSTVFGTYKRLASTDKELVIWHFLGHQIFYQMEERRITALIERLGLKS